jgi:hypothetical protein
LATASRKGEFDESASKWADRLMKTDLRLRLFNQEEGQMKSEQNRKEI